MVLFCNLAQWRNRWPAAGPESCELVAGQVTSCSPANPPTSNITPNHYRGGASALSEPRLSRVELLLCCCARGESTKEASALGSGGRPLPSPRLKFASAPYCLLAGCALCAFVHSEVCVSRVELPPRSHAVHSVGRPKSSASANYARQRLAPLAPSPIPEAVSNRETHNTAALARFKRSNAHSSHRPTDEKEVCQLTG